MRLAMRQFTANRRADSRDEIWLLQHPPVFTLGQAGRAEHLLEQRGIELIQTERGGQITYHGPGQVVAYVLLDLKRRNIKVREFVSLLERAMIATLRRYNVKGQTKPGAPGVYVEQNATLKKIAALGLKIERGCSYHGVSLNVDMDLAPFGWINPCGYAGLQTTDLAHLGQPARVDDVGEELADSIVAALNRHKESDD
jgi:lipoyl(octanoyl) transferase